MQQYPNNPQGQGGREPQRHPNQQQSQRQQQQQQQAQQQQQQQRQQQHHGQISAPGALNVDYQPQNPNQVPSHYQYPYAGMSGQNFSQPGFQMTIRRPSESGGSRPDMRQTSYQSSAPQNNSVGSGSASSSPVNRFSFGGLPYMPMEGGGGGGGETGSNPNTSSMIPSEPRMGHYSNYQHPYPPPSTAYDPGQWQPPPPPPFDPNQSQQQQQHQGGQPSSRRSTISNPSDHERPSRPSTSDAKNTMTPIVKVEPIPQEDDEDEKEEKMDHRKRKRNRTIRSCVPCHNHKRKVRTINISGVIRRLADITVRPEAPVWPMYCPGIGMLSSQ